MSGPGTYPSRGQTVRHGVEDALLRLGFSLVGRMPVERASAFGDRLGRSLGPLLPVSRHGRDNLARAFPETSPAERAALLRDVWENLGRTAAEHPHLSAIADPEGARIEQVNAEIVARIAARGGAAVLISAHLANWEVMNVVGRRLGLELLTVVRRANNPRVDRRIKRCRDELGGDWCAKGSALSGISRHLDEGRVLGLLIDQRLREGIEARFFDQPALTTTVPALLALRYRCPLIPVRIERLPDVRFRITYQPPLSLPDSGDRRADIASLTQQMNDILESWVRERPDQWLWLHRRWRGGNRSPTPAVLGRRPLSAGNREG